MPAKLPNRTAVCYIGTAPIALPFQAIYAPGAPLVNDVASYMGLAGDSNVTKITERFDTALQKQSEYVDELELGIQKSRERAKIAVKSGNKAEALRQLRHSKQKEQMRDSAASALATLEAQRMAIDQMTSTTEVAKLQVDAVKALKKSGMSNDVSKLLKDIDGAQDDMREMEADASDVSEAISQGGSLWSIDENDLEAELAEMLHAQSDAQQDAETRRLDSMLASLDVPSDTNEAKALLQTEHVAVLHSQRRVHDAYIA